MDDEATVWTRASGGDSAAFAQLFDRHRDRVFRHAFRFTRDVHDAEDVTAAVFLELWRRRARVRVVEGSVLPWLLVTATLCWRNLERSQRRYRAFLDALPREERAPGAEEEMLRTHPLDDIEPTLLAALRGLGSVDLQLFALVVLEGLPIGEAAAAAGLGLAAAKTRLHRARRRLRAELGEGYRSTVVAELSEGEPS